MACGLNVEQVLAESEHNTEFKVFDENVKIDIGDKGKEMLQKAFELGHKYENQHKGCARCTVAALQDTIDFIPEDEGLFRSASCLDGGATPTNLANCGAFTGSGMIIGWLCGTDRFGDTGVSNKLIHKVHTRFEKAYGSVICKEIRKSANEKCPDVVGKASQWTTEILLEQFTNYEQT